MNDKIEQIHNNKGNSMYNKLCEIQSLLKKESSLKTLCKYYL